MITFGDLFKVIKKFWYFFAISFLAVVIGIIVYTSVAMPTYFESKSRIYCFAVNENETVGEMQEQQGYTDKFATSHAMAMLTSDGFYSELYEMLDSEWKSLISANGLKQAVSFKLFSAELNIIDLTCYSSNAKLSQNALVNLNKLIEIKLRKLPFDNLNISVMVEEEPIFNDSPITVSKSRYYFYGVVLLIAIGLAELIVFTFVAVKKGYINPSVRKQIEEKSENKVAVN